MEVKENSYKGPVTHRKEGRLILRRAVAGSQRGPGESERASERLRRRPDNDDGDDSLHSQKFFPRGSNLHIRRRPEDEAGDEGTERKTNYKQKEVATQNPSVARTRPRSASVRPFVRAAQDFGSAPSRRGEDWTDRPTRVLSCGLHCIAGSHASRERTAAAAAAQLPSFHLRSQCADFLATIGSSTYASSQQEQEEFERVTELSGA